MLCEGCRPSYVTSILKPNQLSLVRTQVHIQSLSRVSVLSLLVVVGPVCDRAVISLVVRVVYACSLSPVTKSPQCTSRQASIDGLGEL